MDDNDSGTVAGAALLCGASSPAPQLSPAGNALRQAKSERLTLETSSVAKSGYKGVHAQTSGRFVAQGKRNGRPFRLGTFGTRQEAALKCARHKRRTRCSSMQIWSLLVAIDPAQAPAGAADPAGEAVDLNDEQ